MRKLIIPYLIVALFAIAIIGLLIFYKQIDFKYPSLNTLAYCFLFGALGGIIHCVRGYYLHYAALKDWDSTWEMWYLVRPIVSGVMGFISLIFIKAGLLMFSASSQIVPGGTIILAYFAVAFIAGYNVQSFLVKLEDIFEAVLGIEKKSLPRQDKTK